jgi:hypothetical protein
VKSRERLQSVDQGIPPLYPVLRQDFGQNDTRVKGVYQ